MDFCGPYDKYLANQHREFLHSPLLAGWEFRQKTSLLPQTAEWMSLEKAQDWVLPSSVRQELLSDAWAIVITDIDQHIQYVNARFEEMTGYSRLEAIGLQPGFLQGEATSPRMRRRIRQGVDRLKPVRGRIINYRKDQTPYWCHIVIRPIVNRQKEVVNFIAFEQEVQSNGKPIVR
ncbi:PAS domain-containing protein [Spirosoma sp. HMF3257]|uniref:PAS sensor protein n=1 Tax=Spirosoma telluris TaxID=2183553 RepID=A0A327NKF2_9BACT|nr:PAS domain-containing protein [Spirosoma telluris]RAI75273.1 PAS sensor protein [Spirosoma telluris]